MATKSSGKERSSQVTRSCTAVATPLDHAMGRNQSVPYDKLSSVSRAMSRQIHIQNLEHLASKFMKDVEHLEHSASKFVQDASGENLAPSRMNRLTLREGVARIQGLNSTIRVLQLPGDTSHLHQMMSPASKVIRSAP